VFSALIPNPSADGVAHTIHANPAERCRRRRWWVRIQHADRPQAAAPGGNVGVKDV
jgi:hypothetical protein